MHRLLAVALLVAVSLAARVAAAQSNGLPASAAPDAFGTGPRVDVQTGANGTLDVAGARGADINLTGENLRGNLGAARQQTVPAAGPSAPTNLPLYRSSDLGAPNFSPSLSNAGNGPSGNAASARNPRADLADLILPRFQGVRIGEAARTAAGHAPVNRWRYRFFSGRWWYWQPGESWIYWNGSQWLDYSEPR